MKGIYDEIERLSTIRFTPKDDINEMLEQNNSSHLKRRGFCKRTYYKT